ncbi:MAG: hypothetical protein L3J76_06160 [Candidatus Hydrothermae bacterium]|nr:hypothetical protein [Candidatus Hydrothermae bacterium]
MRSWGFFFFLLSVVMAAGGVYAYVEMWRPLQAAYQDLQQDNLKLMDQIRRELGGLQARPTPPRLPASTEQALAREEGASRPVHTLRFGINDIFQRHSSRLARGTEQVLQGLFRLLADTTGVDRVEIFIPAFRRSSKDLGYDLAARRASNLARFLTRKGLVREKLLLSFASGWDRDSVEISIYKRTGEATTP